MLQDQGRELRVVYEGADALPSWPVTWGVPLEPGRLSDPARIRLRDEAGRPLPTQARVLGSHPDGSIRRMVVTAEPGVTGPGVTTYRLDFGGPGPQPTPPAAAGTNGLLGAAWQLRCEAGQVFLDTPPGRFALSVELADEAGPLTWRAERFEVFEPGPVLAAAVITGAATAPGRDPLEVRLTCRLPAATPVLLCDVLILNRLVTNAVSLRSACLRLAGPPRWERATWELRQRPVIQQTGLPLRMRSEKLALRWTSPEGAGEHRSRLLNYNETWLAAEGDGRLLLGLKSFFELYPYAARVEPDGLTVEFWPADEDRPWVLEAGVGKTHELGLAVLPADPEPWSSRGVGQAIGKPPLPHVPLATMQAGQVFEELGEYLPDTYPRLETTLYDLVHNRNRGYGKMNWGDDISELYTNQLRGAGEVVWNNLEGDWPYHLWCQFVRTGRLLYHQEFGATIRHWADVDFADRCAEPLNEGALHVHSARHVTSSTSPCHNWAEGFREWYYQTGDPRPLEILSLMADWLLRRAKHGAFTCDPRPYVRGCGWGLIQMNALDEVLDRVDLRDTAEDLCRRLLEYARANDGLAMQIPTGGTWEARDNAFHTATVVIGAWSWQRRTGLGHARALAVEAAEAFFDQRTCTPEGIPVYISGPEQAFPMQQAATLTMGALAAAWHLTGEERYVRRGMRMLEYCLDRGLIVDHMRIPGHFEEYGDDVVLQVSMLMPNTQLLSYQLRGLLLFLPAAHQAGMLREVEYRY